jgi:sugar (pentulose or hexulose) kinase
VSPASNTQRHVIGVDIGTQSTKAVLVDATGRLVAQHSASYRVDTPYPMWAQQWPQVWLDAVVACVHAVVADSGVAPESVAGMCISSLYGGSGVPVDAEGEPTHPCLIWMDRRAQDEVDWVRANVDLERLFDVTCNGVDSYYGYTKMLWLRDKAPEAWARTTALLPPNTYVNAQFTGEVAVDHSSACNIGGIYDVAARRWSGDMLQRLGLPAEMMPRRLVESTDTVGHLLPKWAARLGLPAGVPLMAGGVDAAVATLAAGASRPGNHVAMIGTSMCWGSIRTSADARHGLISMPHVVNGPRDLYVFGGAITAGASVTWFRDNFCQGEIAQAKEQGGDAHQLLEQAASQLQPGAEGLLFLPYLMGERSPIWDANATGAFVGLGLHHRREHLYRAVLEGVSHALRHNIDTGTLDGSALDAGLTVVGGASRSDLWMQIIADITGRTVFTLRDDVEASMGAAMLAAIGSGLADLPTVQRDWVHLVERARPTEEGQRRYAANHQQYVNLYPALRPAMHALRRNMQD